MRRRKGRDQRRQPERSCVACQEPQTKRELVRIVRTPQGTVEIDRGGKRSGRGAYLCLKEACWRVGLKGNRLERSLHLATPLPPEERARLAEEGKALLSQAAAR